MSHESIVKNKQLIHQYLEIMGATHLYTVHGSFIRPVEPKKNDSNEGEILSTRPRRKYVYNPRTKDFDVLVIKVEKRENAESVSTAPKKEKKASKSMKLAAKVPIAWTTSKPSEKNFSVKKFNGQVHQPRLHN